MASTSSITIARARTSLVYLVAGPSVDTINKEIASLMGQTGAQYVARSFLSPMFFLDQLALVFTLVWPYGQLGMNVMITGTTVTV
jgi:hypothetical protein